MPGHDEPVVPVLENPPTHPFLENGEVDHPPHFVETPGGVNEDDVVVAVQIGARPFVPNEAMPRAEVNSANDLEVQDTASLAGLSESRLLPFQR